MSNLTEPVSVTAYVDQGEPLPGNIADLIAHVVRDGDMNVVFSLGGGDHTVISLPPVAAQKFAEELSARAAYLDKRMDLTEQSALISRALDTHAMELGRVIIEEGRLLPSAAVALASAQRQRAIDLRDQLNGMVR